MSDPGGTWRYPECDKCGDSGSRYDQACLDNTCAHGARTLSDAEYSRLRKAAKQNAVTDARHENTVLGVAEPVSRKLPRIMPCPLRPCKCSAGVTARAKLKAAGDQQWERLK